MGEIYQKIVEKLENLKSKGKIDQIVKDKIEFDPARTYGNVVAYVRLARTGEAFLTNVENERVYAFEIGIWISKQLGEEKAMQKEREILDDILNEFDKDFTLGGTCLGIEPLVWEGGAFAKEGQVWLERWIILKAKVSVSIT